MEVKKKMSKENGVIYRISGPVVTATGIRRLECMKLVELGMKD